MYKDYNLDMHKDKREDISSEESEYNEKCAFVVFIPYHVLSRGPKLGLIAVG